ncbi:MAG: UTP--glucose-1-phosphate uridylyltransferase [Spirochaetes bacterium]|nr:UTP--glucose-1-phosphate uridylyltransferase [Spirochaetota bacterium]
METFLGYDDVIKKFFSSGEGHLFEHWNELSATERKEFIEELSHIDFRLVTELKSLIKRESHVEMQFEPAPYISLNPLSDEYARAKEVGESHLRNGKVAAFVVAGGQGSRLGYEGPKGCYPLGEISGKSLFQIHAEKILKYSQKYGVRIPWLIMTSQSNHHQTVEFLRSHNNFGIEPSDLFIFSQAMVPSLDLDGKLVLESPTRLFKNPDGHGGSLTALASSGVLDALIGRGIETISYFQVDNPLVKIIDPVFIGVHLLQNAEVSSKGLPKIGPEEKIGVFVNFPNGRLGVIEYSDLPEERAKERDADGKLKFLMGSPAIHLFQCEFIRKITSEGQVRLPFHIAKKKLKVWKQGTVVEIDGLKFEKFVFDAIPLAERSIVFEMRREEEFAPVKNLTGVDSVESARALMNNLFKEWLTKKGIEIPPKVRIVEISPLLAVEAEDLPQIAIPNKEMVYLE